MRETTLSPCTICGEPCAQAEAETCPVCFAANLAGAESEPRIWEAREAARLRALDEARTQVQAALALRRLP